MKIEPGTYGGTVTAASIYEAPSRAVMCRMKVEVEGTGLQGGICLVQKDGTLSERGFRDVQAIFGWSDWDWAKWDQDPETFAGAAVQVVIETVQGEKGEFSSIKYINPPGGGGAQLEKGNARVLAAKYGAKTRALFGGTAAARPGPMRPATLGPKLPVAAPRPPPPQAAPKVPTCPASTMEACWDAFTKMNEGRPEHELYAGWSALLEEVHPGKGQNDLTPIEWGVVLATLNHTPF